MLTAFELFLLDNGTGDGVIALARRGSDTAIERIPADAALKKLADFGRHIGRAVTGNDIRPTATELTGFGNELFKYLFRGELKRLYDRLPTGAVTLQILSDRPEIKDVPWEYLAMPDRQPSPHRDRSVVRIHPTCGIDSPEPKKYSKKVRVLFVSSEPVDQEGLNWEDIAAVLDRTFRAEMPEEISVKVIEGATRQGMLRAVNNETFDVFHFFGHGVLKNGVGHLVLEEIRTKRSDYLSATDLARALAGKGVRLAILSACLSGAGKYTNDFDIIATALIKAGIPAVVANQYPIPIRSISPFVGSIYSTLILNGNIDSAVADGRVILAVGIGGSIGNNAVVEWGIPTLHRLPEAQQIFQVQP